MSAVVNKFNKVLVVQITHEIFVGVLVVVVVVVVVIVVVVVRVAESKNKLC